MPYIRQEDRLALDKILNELCPTSDGELNYVITRICHNYLRHTGVRYATLNSVVGVLSCAQLEIYRRIVAGYEDDKIKENGDVVL